MTPFSSSLVYRYDPGMYPANHVRITPNSRGCNSSSSFSEQWGVALHATPEQLAANRRRGAFIHYADLATLMVMLDMKPGGGVMDAVNEGQKLVRPRVR